MEPAPIALFVFRRPEHTRRTLEFLRRNEGAAASPLHVFCDGPRNGEDLSAVEEVRRIVRAAEGFASLEIHEAEANRGLAASVIAGVSEMIRRYGRVIVLEDDMECAPYFLRFMNEGLERFRDDERIAEIHGYTAPMPETVPECFLRPGADCWGWATWERGWKLFNPDSAVLLKELNERGLVRDFDRDGVFPWYRMLEDQATGKVDSWAIRWHASVFLAGKFMSSRMAVMRSFHSAFFERSMVTVWNSPSAGTLKRTEHGSEYAFCPSCIQKSCPVGTEPCGSLSSNSIVFSFDASIFAGSAAPMEGSPLPMNSPVATLSPLPVSLQLAAPPQLRAGTGMMTQEELIRRIDRNRAWQWRVMSLVVVIEAFAALAAGLILLFSEYSRVSFYVGFFGALLPLFGMALPVLVGVEVEKIGKVRCLVCRKRNQSEPVLRNGFCSFCGSLFFVPEPAPASAFRNRSLVIINLVQCLFWLGVWISYAHRLSMASDSPLVVIADFALIQSGLLFLLLPLMWYLRTSFWARRDIRPLDHLEETVTLKLSRAEFKRSANRETWLGLSVVGLAVVPPFVVILILSPGVRLIGGILMLFWMFGVFALGIAWSLRRDRKVLSAALLEQCPVCRRGGRFRFFRWESSKLHVDETFWRTVLRTSRCPHCGCRLRFQDDPEEKEE